MLRQHEKWRGRSSPALCCFLVQGRLVFLELDGNACLGNLQKETKRIAPVFARLVGLYERRTPK